MENRRKKPSHNQDTSTSSTITAVRGLTGQEDLERKSKQCSGGVEVVPEKLPGANIKRTSLTVNLELGLTIFRMEKYNNIDNSDW